MALGYSQDQEFEADAAAFRATLALGHRREAVLESVRGMAVHAPQEPARRIRPRAGDLPQRVGHEIDNHFRSHPPFVERVEWLESLPVAGK